VKLKLNGNSSPTTVCVRRFVHSRLQKVWLVIQVSVFYFSVTVTYCFTG